MKKIEVYTEIAYSAQLPDEIMTTIQEEILPKDIAKFFCAYLNRRIITTKSCKNTLKPFVIAQQFTSMINEFTES